MATARARAESTAIYVPLIPPEAQVVIQTQPVLPDGNVGYDYTEHYFAFETNYRGGRTWELSGGSLPPGLALFNGQFGQVGGYAGTPITPGTFHFSITLKSDTGDVLATKDFTHTIAARPTERRGCRRQRYRRRFECHVFPAQRAVWAGFRGARIRRPRGAARQVPASQERFTSRPTRARRRARARREAAARAVWNLAERAARGPLPGLLSRLRWRDYDEGALLEAQRNSS